MFLKYDFFLVMFKGGGTYFHGGGGGGAKTPKMHNNVKKGTNGAHADNITNVLMKHHCRQSFFVDKVALYMLNVFFLAGGTE